MTTTLINGSSQKPANWIPAPTDHSYEPRKIRMITVGAGFSGLMMAHKIQHEFQLEDFIDHIIYEKNNGVGGTWYENHYAGAACDVPAHMYTFSFEPNPHWSSFFAGAPEIKEYIHRTTKKYNLDKNIQFNTTLTDAQWDEESGKWKIKLEKDGKIIEDEGEILVDATGFLNKWSWPEIEGLKDFKGHIVHTARWDDSFDYANKRIALIGNGSSALQILPQLAKVVGTGHLTNFIRNPTWVSATYLSQFTKDGGNFEYTEEEKKEFQENPEKHFEYRQMLEHNFNMFFYVMIKNSPGQKACFESFTKMMQERLKNDPLLCEKLIPKWEVGCRRLSPGEGYLEAFHNENVSPNFSPIERITEKGIFTTADGEIEFDAIICATGFDVSYVPRWNTIGRNGFDLAKHFSAPIPKAYMSINVEQMPNYFIFNGPNACAGHGSLLAVMDWTAAHIAKWAKKIATEDIKSVVVKPEVVDDWNVWAQEVLKTTVWSGGCKSWYKKNSEGRDNEPVTAMYPGSVLHYKEILDTLRVEDFDVRYRGVNRFRFLGNGLTQREKDPKDLAFYLK